MRKIKFKALNVHFNKISHKMDKLQLSMAKEAYKRGFAVTLVLRNGDVVVPGSYSAFKFIYKVERSQDAIISIDFEY